MSDGKYRNRREGEEKRCVIKKKATEPFFKRDTTTNISSESGLQSDVCRLAPLRFKPVLIFL